MRINLLLVTALLAVLLGGTGSTVAQAPLLPGNLLVLDSSSANFTIGVLDGNGVLATLNTLPSVTNIAADDQGNIAILESTVPPAVLIRDSSGAFTTLYSGLPLIVPEDVRFRPPSDNAGWGLYILDRGADAIFSLNASGGISTVTIGSPLANSSSLAIDPRGNLVVGDTTSGVLRVTSSGVVTTLVTLSGLSPRDVEVDPIGNVIVASNGASNGLVQIDRFGAITTIASGAPFSDPMSVTIGLDGNYYVADPIVDAVFQVTKSGTVTTFATSGSFAAPTKVVALPRSDDAFHVFDKNARSIYGIDAGGNAFVRSTLLPGAKHYGATRRHDGRTVLAANDTVLLIEDNGTFSTVFSGAPLQDVSDIVMTPAGDYLLSATVGLGGMVWKLAGSTITTLVDGATQFSGMVRAASAIEVDAFGQIYVADNTRRAIWRFSADGASMTTLFRGTPLSNPISLDWGDRNFLYVGDASRNRIYRLDRAGAIEEYFAESSILQASVITQRADGTFLIADNVARALYSIDENKTLSTVITSAFGSGVAAIVPSGAVPRFGDLVVANGATGAEISILGRLGKPQVFASPDEALRADATATDIMPDLMNGEFIGVFAGTTSAGVSRIGPNGFSPIHWGAPFTAPTSVVLDQNGDYIVTESSATAAVIRIDRSTGALTTIASGGALKAPQSICLHADSGDFLVADSTEGALLWVTPDGSSVSTLAAIANVNEVVHDVWSGNFFATDVTGSLYRVTRTGVISTLYSNGVLDAPTGLTITPAHDLLVTDAGTPPNGVYAFDVQGNLSATIVATASSSWAPSAVAVAFSRTLAGYGSAQVGTTYRLSIHAPADGALSYQLAASLTTRPVVMIDGRGIALQPDQLTLLSLSLPTIFRKFTGTLDAFGKSDPRFAIPNEAGLIGIRVHFGGLTQKAGYGRAGIHTVFNNVAVTIR